MAVEVTVVFIFLYVAEHSSVIHMVSVDKVKRIRKVIVVNGRQINGARQTAFAVYVLVGVLHIVLTLHDRIIYMSIQHRDPGTGVGIDFLYLFKSRFLLFHYRPELSKIGAHEGHSVGVDRIVQHKPAVCYQIDSKQRRQR